MKWQQSGGFESMQFTLAMTAVYVGVFAAQQTRADLTILLALPWRIGDGQTWRLITSTALHGSLLHFGFNLMMYLRFSQAIERWLGPWISLFLYVLFAASSSAAQMLLHGIPSIGASGVVYGLFGFLWITRRRYDIAAEVTPPQTIQVMFGWIVVCAVLNFFGAPIANTAHIVGLGFGCLAGHVVIAPRRRRIPLAALTAFASIGLLLLTYKPIWVQTLGRLPYLKNQYRDVLLDKDDWAEREAMYAEGGFRVL